MSASVKTITNNMGYQQIADLSVAIGLTVPSVVPAGVGLKVQPSLAVIQCTVNNVRWRDDGGTPDSTTGMVLVVGDTLYYDGDLPRIKFIQAAAGAKLDVTYYS